jgi:hypothetical protein
LPDPFIRKTVFMTIPAGRRGSFLLVAPLLLISILLEQVWIVRLLPWMNDLGGVQPMIVFLDIPLRLPVVNWIPVGILFAIFYKVVAGQKGWAVLGGWWVLLFCLVAGGGLYQLLEGYLPKQVRNGIDSFGIRADIALPYPGERILHLHGGMILLGAMFIGGRFLLKRAQLPVATPPIQEQLPPEPGPAMVRPCVVRGVLEPTK